MNIAVAPLSSKAEWSDVMPVSGAVSVTGISRCRFFLGLRILKKNFSGCSDRFSNNVIDFGVFTTASETSSVVSTSSIGSTENLLFWANRRERLIAATRCKNPAS